MFIGLVEKNPAGLRPNTSTGKVHTDVPVCKVSMNIQIKVPEPKAFDGEMKDAKSWLK